MFMKTLKPYFGVALIVVGAILLVVCYVAQRESNTELLIGLMFIVLGYLLHLRMQKRGEKY